MISGLISLFYDLFFAPFPWSSLGGLLEIPYNIFQSIGL